MRGTWLVLSTLILASAASAAAADLPPDSHVRCLDARSSELLTHALEASPTVTRLVDSLQTTDVIVLIRVGTSMARLSAGTEFMSATPGARYLLIELQPFASEDELMSLLGHELEHATEVAAALDVRDDAGMERLFKLIGFPSSIEDGYETQAALDAGREVLQEVSEGHGRPSQQA